MAHYGYGNAGLTAYWHPDWLGSIRLQTTPSRTVLQDNAFAPYGEAYALQGPQYPTFSFSGTNQDTSSLYEFPFRDYHATEGRWVTPDPAGLAAVDLTNPQSLNRYAYVLNNPCTLTDPLGLDPCGQNPVDPGFFGAGSIQLRPGSGGGGWFDAPRSGGRSHRGIDISAGGGTPLVPFLPGTVVFVGNRGALGQTVIVSAGSGYTYLYGHLQAAFVTPGEQLNEDTLVGFTGNTGNAANLPAGEGHVHLQLYGPGNSLLNPISFMNKPCPKGVHNFQPPRPPKVTAGVTGVAILYRRGDRPAGGILLITSNSFLVPVREMLALVRDGVQDALHQP